MEGRLLVNRTLVRGAKAKGAGKLFFQISIRLHITGAPRAPQTLVGPTLMVPVSVP